MSGQRPRSISLAAASDYFFVLVDFRLAKIKREFRTLRSPTQGSALRTRKPLKRFDPNFISPTHFIRAQRENKDSDLRALGGLYSPT